MPVDADAYMAGAIPALSRGGSWLPGEHNAGSIIPPMGTHQGFAFGSSPHSAYGPQTPPPPGPAVYAGRASGLGPAGVGWNPYFAKTVAGGGGGAASGIVAAGSGGGAWGMGSVSGSISPSAYGRPGAPVRPAQSEMAGAATIHGLKREQVLGPVQHFGWLKTGSEADGGGGSVAGSFESASFAGGGGGGGIAKLAPPARSMASVASIPHSMRSNRSRRYSEKDYQGHHFDEHLPVEMGRSWERHGGSPKPTTPEPDYGIRRDSGGKGRHHGGGGGGGGGRRISDATANAPSPYKKLSEHVVLPPASSDGRPPSSHGHSRPQLKRRHSHTPTPPLLSPKPKKSSGEDDLGRSAQMNCRLARLSLQGRDCKTPDPPPSSPLIGQGHSSVPPVPRGGPLSPGGTGSNAGSGAGAGGRPSMVRRHTSVASQTSHAPSSLPTSPVHNKHLTQVQHPRTRHSSTPHSPRSPHSPQAASPGYDDRAAAGSTVDFTAPPPPPASGGRSRAGSLAGTPTVKTFPRLSGNADSPLSPLSPGSAGSHRAPSGVFGGAVVGGKDVPIGYISPLADEPYDRYAAHPSAPAPDRLDRALHGGSSPSYAGTHTETESLLRPPQERPPSNGEYLPLGYARPVRDVAWNREGPAMKTHGIAWLREGDPGRLPEGPEGPRWAVARPPRGEHVLGGGWWQSGGDGTATASGSRV
ncbi:hypothetical protein IAT38_006745 [Cryptococcus sp. DSM 104549]